MEEIFLQVPYYLNFSNPTTILLWVVAIVLALSIHEFFHAATASLLGDQTAKMQGRLSLNPIVHIDPLGLILAVFAGFGWAKPVPFNPYNLRIKKWGPTLVAVAGPISNFVQAAVAAIGIHLATASGIEQSNLLMIFLGYYFLINVALFFFNLIPVPPLDGSKLLLDALSSPKYARARFVLETKGPFILLGIIALQFLFNISILGFLFSFVFRFVFFPIFRIGIGLF